MLGLGDEGIQMEVGMLSGMGTDGMVQKTAALESCVQTDG